MLTSLRVLTGDIDNTQFKTIWWVCDGKSTCFIGICPGMISAGTSRTALCPGDIPGYMLVGYFNRNVRTHIPGGYSGILVTGRCKWGQIFRPPKVPYPKTSNGRERDPKKSLFVCIEVKVEQKNINRVQDSSCIHGFIGGFHKCYKNYLLAWTTSEN